MVADDDLAEFSRRRRKTRTTQETKEGDEEE